MKCRLLGNPLELVLDLGMQPLGNGFLQPHEIQSSVNEYFFPLQCGFNEESRLFQLATQPSPQLMFHADYAFLTRTSMHMTEHFKNLAEELVLRYRLGPQSFVIEIGCNDGALIEQFALRGIRHLGIEPSSSIANTCREYGVEVWNDFFDKACTQRIISEYGKADLILAANVLCHIADVAQIAESVNQILTDSGLLVFEDPYLGSMINKGSYDQIYDEHVFMFSALSVQKIFGVVGLELIDVEELSTHGGSMRYTVGRQGVHRVSTSVARILDQELKQGLHKLRTYHSFSERVKKSGSELRQVLEALKKQGKDVAAFGATSKSTTIYNFAGIGPDLITRIYDNSPTKIGKVSPGVHIPVVESSKFEAEATEVAFLAAWNHEKEIRRKYASFESLGGLWLTHVPNVHILAPSP